MGKIVNIDIDRLKDLYVNQKLTVPATARALGVSSPTVRTRLMSEGIPIRSVIIADLEEMRRLYVDEGLTFNEVGKRFGVTRQDVHFRLRRAGIAKRPSVLESDVVSLDVLNEMRRLYEDERFSIDRLAKHFGVASYVARDRLVRSGATIYNAIRPTFTFDRDLIYNLYINERLSFARMSARLGVGQNVVIRELRRHGIPARPRWVTKRVDRDALYKLYVTDGFDQPTTASMLGISRSTLLRELRRHGIKFRHKCGKKRKHG